jgi:hypothetical protein
MYACMREHPHQFWQKKPHHKSKTRKHTHTHRRERQRALHLIDSSDLSLPIQFNGEICRWKTRWNMSEVKPSTQCETLVLTNIELYPFIATILLPTLLTMTASTETGERSFSEMNRI